MKDTYIVMEIHHGRKTKRGLKGIIKKVALSGLVMSMVLGSALPTFAFDKEQAIKEAVLNEAQSYTEKYSVSLSDAISAVESTLTMVNGLKSSGSVSTSALNQLANEIYALERAYNSASNKDLYSVENVLSTAEKAIAGVKDASTVELAIAYVRDSLGIGTITVQQYKASSSITFSDVTTADWFYDNVMAMASQGIVNGYTDGTFGPQKNMTRAEFIAVVTRIFYMDKLNSIDSADSSVWYSNNYIVAVEKGIVKEHEFSLSDMSEVCSRQEMAMFMVRALENAKGEKADQLISASIITDFNDIGTYYQNYVKQAYSMGLLTGRGEGKFEPKENMTRAEAATALYRMIDASTRVEVDFTIPVEVQTWVEGQPHNQPHKGDIVIKADGTQVVLDYGWGKVLGAGQGVDIYTGWNNPGGSTVDGTNASGVHDLTTVKKDPITGEAHTKDEWIDISRETLPREAGSYEGEVRNTWFTWNGFLWTTTIPR